MTAMENAFARARSAGSVRRIQDDYRFAEEIATLPKHEWYRIPRAIDFGSDARPDCLRSTWVPGGKHPKVSSGKA